MPIDQMTVADVAKSFQFEDYRVIGGTSGDYISRIICKFKDSVRVQLAGDGEAEILRITQVQHA